MIKAKLPTNIDKSQVEVTNITDKSATVKAISNSAKYKGNIKVNFTIDKSEELSKVFTNLNLATIETNGQSLTEEMIKAKLPTNIDKSQVEVTNITDKSATVKAISNSAKYKGNIKVNFTIDKSEELSKVFTNLNLATIETNGQSLTEEMIKAKLPTNIDKSQVEVTNITDKSATVKAISNSAKYKGNIKVNFTIDKSEELSKVFTNLNLATIETNGQSLTEEMIKAKLPTNIDKSQVEVTNITDKSATVKAISNSAKYKGNIKVNFTIDKSEELSKVFTNLNLATIETNGQSLTEEMIKAKLPTNIDKSQVEVTNITDKSATVKAISNSAKYKGNIKVNFTIDKSEELSKAFTNLNLATIATNGQSLTEEMIKNELSKKIVDKKKTNIKSIKFIQIKNKSAKIEYKYKSVYKGSVEVTYTLDTKQTLDSLLSEDEKKLKTIATNGQSLTEEMIKAKLPTNIDKSQVEVTNITDKSATVKAISNSAKYKGNIKVNFTIDKSEELSKVFTNLNLATIETNGQSLTEEMIKAKLPTNIDKSQVEVTNITDKSATVKAISNSAKYKGNIKVNFTIDKSEELSKVFTNLNLATIETNGQSLTEEMIKAKLPTNIDKSQVEVTNITDKSATVKAISNSAKYKGNIKVNFTIDKSEELSKAFTNLNLATIATNGQSLTEEMIKNELSKKIVDKKKTNIKSIKFIQIKNKSAKIEYKYKSVYKGSVEVTYTLDTKQTLDSLLSEDEKKLKTIATNGQSLTEEMIKAKLPTNIDKSQVEVTNITDKSATVKAISNSAKYKGNIKVNFTIDKSEELSKAFTNLNLATIETNGQSLTEEMIKAKLPTNIDKSQVEVTNITDKSATVKAISNSAKYKGNIKVNYSLDSRFDLEIKIPVKERHNKNENVLNFTLNYEEEIKKFIESKYSLDFINFEVKFNFSNLFEKLNTGKMANKIFVTIKSKQNSSSYKGAVNLTFWCIGLV